MAADRFSQMLGIVTSLQGDFEKFYVKGVKKAGTRVRKGMREVTILAKEIRLEVSAIKKAGDNEEGKDSKS